MPREWINRLRYLGRRRELEADLDAEVQFHIEARAADLMESGMPRGDALAQARREFGSIAIMREDSRSAWQFRWLADLAADLRFALRAFRRSPGFTLTAVLSLALGVGANSAIFTAMNAMLWKPLPVVEPQNLVTLSVSRADHAPSDLPSTLLPQLRESGIFADIVAKSSDGLSFAYEGRAERIMGEVVSPNFFTFLGVQPILGDGFTADVRAGHWAPEAVLSYHFWKRRFGGDPGIVGHTIRLNSYPFTVAGVSPPSFFGVDKGKDPELRIPFLPDGGDLGEMRLISTSQPQWLSAMARLKPGKSLAEAEGAADAQLQEWIRITPVQEFRGARLLHLRLLPGGTGWDSELRQFRTPLLVLQLLVAIVLLIACSNIASMLLARATARRRELAVRSSIGAGRGRLVRQMMAESILLAILGGMLSLPVAWWAAQLVQWFLPQGHEPIVVDLRPDAQTLCFAFALSLITGVLFGLAPAIHSTRGQFAAMLKSDSAASIGERTGAAFRKALVVLQVAFSLVLLIAAGLFIRTLSHLRPADYRTPERIFLFTMKPQPEIYTPDRVRHITAELIRRVSVLPGVQFAALAETGPLASRQSSVPVQVPGQQPIRASSDDVTPGFFDTIGVRLVAGRDFRAADAPGAAPVAIVNQMLARALFQNQNPIGRTFDLPLRNQARRFEVIGVAADSHYHDLHVAPTPTVWFAYQNYPPYMPTLHVRCASSGTGGLIDAVRREFDEVDKGFPVFNIKTMELRIEDSLARERLVADLSTGFGSLALLLSAIGLYGILAYSVSRRTREIGIRMAMGSQRGSILWLIGREALSLVAAGTITGALLAVLADRLLEQYLIGVSVVNLASLLGPVGLILAIAAMAIAIPAFRACRVDPLTALRHE